MVHSVKATAANVHDVTMTSELLTGEENEVYGDSGYIGADKREDAVIWNKKGQENQIQNQSETIANQEIIGKWAVCGEKSGA